MAGDGSLVRRSKERLKRETYYMIQSKSKRYVLLGVDPELSAVTRHALHTAGAFFASSAGETQFLLLSVIPLPIVTGRYGHPSLLAPTTGQRVLAAEALRIASAILQHHGVPRSQIETVIQVGRPADELLYMAHQHHIDCLIIGNREFSAGQWVRRLFLGSTSRDISQHASCPVLLATLPPSRPQTHSVGTHERVLANQMSEAARSAG